MVTLVGRGHCVIAALFHAVSDDNTAEFDPYYIERIKNCLSMMFEKDLVHQLELEIQTKHTYKNKKLAEQFNAKIAEDDNQMDMDNQSGNGEMPHNQDILRTAQKRKIEEEHGGKLLTSRANHGFKNRAASTEEENLMRRGVRKTDHVRKSILSQRNSISASKPERPSLVNDVKSHNAAGKT